METGLFVLINVVVFSALAVAMTLASRAPGRGGWLAANLAVLGVAGAFVWLGSPLAPWVTLAVFAILVAAPLVLLILARQRAMKSDMAGAAQMMRAAAIFAPTRSNRFQVRVLEALALPDKDTAARALEALVEVAPDEASAVLALGHAARARDDWETLARLARQSRDIPADLVPFAVRALGETGAVEEMVRVYAATRETARADALAALDLFTFAFSGRVIAVDRLLGGPLAGLDGDTRTFWNAVARLHADPADRDARAALDTLVATARNSVVRRAAARHAAAVAGAPVVLSPEAAAIVDGATARIGRMPRRAGGLLRSPATLVLLGMIGAVFVYSEMHGGSENIDVLFRLGAAESLRVLGYGDWWRLVAALFLHFGFAHVFANSVMLALLGPVVERRYGSVAVLAAFFVGGIGSMLAVVVMMDQDIVTHGILVGASGAVFALIGFEGARRFLAWRRSRDRVDRGEVLSILIAVGVQAAVDLSIPEISFAAHASGFLIGLMLGFLWREARA